MCVSKAMQVTVLLLVGALLASAMPVWGADTRSATLDIHVDWPEFRGPTGNGLVAAPGDAKKIGLPITWSESENIRWKIEAPFLGWSTPVVNGNDIWLTSATEDGKDFYVLCVDSESGKIRINEKLFHSDNPEPLGNNVNCYASPSPAIDGGKVFVHFGSYGTACLDTESGKTIWTRQDLPCRHFRGPGSSVALFKDLVLLTFDGIDLQYVVALNKNTGNTVWRTDRTTAWRDLDEQGEPKRGGDFRKAYSTPLVFDANGRPEMMSVGSSCAFAYDPLTGEELWKVRLPGYTPAARPVFGGGLVYFTSGRGEPELLAYRPDGSGDVTDSHRAWKFEGKDVPLESSPILVGDLIFMISSGGTASCLEAATGTPVWRERIGGNYVSSPIYADGHLYFCSVQGSSTVLKAGRTFEVVASNELESGFMASPAVTGKALILRTKTHLYRIEDSKLP